MSPSIRSFLKCQPCRHDKKKCEESSPISRKCRRCERLGKSCGSRQRASSGSEQTLIHLSSALETQISPEPNQMAVRIDAHGCIYSRDQSTASKDGLLSNACGQFSLLTLLVRCKHDLSQIRHRNPNNYDLSLEHRDLIINRVSSLAIQRYQENLISWRAKAASSTRETDRTTEIVYYIVTDQMDKLCARWRRLSVPDVIYNTVEILPAGYDVRQALFESVSSVAHMQCVQHILTDGQLLPSQALHDESCVRETSIERYQLAQLQIEQIYREIHDVLDNLDAQELTHRQVGNRDFQALFPAAHIAYLNGAKDVGLHLSTNGINFAELPLNLCNQNIIHLAVQSHDDVFLARLQDYDSEGLKLAATRFPGNTPVMLAATLNTPACLNILVGDCVDVMEYTCDLLDVAVESGSWNIIEPILQRRRLVHQPSTKMIMKAIGVGIEATALKLLPYIRLPPQYHEPKLDELAACAERKDFHALAADLRSTPCYPSGPGRAIRALQQHDNSTSNQRTS